MPPQPRSCTAGLVDLVLFWCDLYSDESYPHTPINLTIKALIVGTVAFRISLAD